MSNLFRRSTFFMWKILPSSCCEHYEPLVVSSTTVRDVSYNREETP